jgi:dTDP-4-amino-4,6-dideoxygalactose transaminase
MSFFKDYKGITVFDEPGADFCSNHWLTCIIVEPGKTRKNVSREDIRLGLWEQNIESRPLWKPMHIQPVFKDAIAFQNGTSEFLFEHGLCLPSGTNMNKDDKERIFNTLQAILG